MTMTKWSNLTWNESEVNYMVVYVYGSIYNKSSRLVQSDVKVQPIYGLADIHLLK